MNNYRIYYYRFNDTILYKHIRAKNISEAIEKARVKHIVEVHVMRDDGDYHVFSTGVDV